VEHPAHNAFFFYQISQKKNMSINSAPVTNPSTLSYSAVLQQPARLPSSSSIKFIPTNKPLVNPDGSFTIFSWKNTRSSLQDKPFVGRVPPNTTSPNSLFIDSKSNSISDKAILSFFREELLGVAFFPTERFIQLTFKDQLTYEKHLSNGCFVFENKTIHLTPPKTVPRQSLVIHLHGLPICSHDEITNAISTSLSKFCNIKEIAPVLIADTDLLTPKWDAVVQPIPGQQIPAHLTILNINASVALTFMNSPQICLRCHSQNHLNMNCPLCPTTIRKPNPAKTYAGLNNYYNGTQQTNTNTTIPPHSKDTVLNNNNSPLKGSDLNLSTSADSNNTQSLSDNIDQISMHVDQPSPQNSLVLVLDSSIHSPYNNTIMDGKFTWMINLSFLHCFKVMAGLMHDVNCVVPT